MLNWVGMGAEVAVVDSMGRDFVINGVAATLGDGWFSSHATDRPRHSMRVMTTDTVHPLPKAFILPASCPLAL